jgi:hypothetical protein
MMYFGLTNALAYLMDLMNKVFMEYLNKFVIVFNDDVLVYSKSEEEPEEHLHLVLQKLQDPRLYAKLSKCKFWSERSTSLHAILEEGIFVDSSRTQDMLSWKALSSVIDGQSSLGLVGYYEKIIEGFSKTTKPTTKLLEKDKKFKWTPACEVCF